jgi:hypothetical protein
MEKLSIDSKPLYCFLVSMKLHDGEIINDDWSFDNVGEMDGDTFRRLPWMSEIDTSLCETATIAKTEDGRYLLIWEHRHPEMVSFSECFPDAPKIWDLPKDHQQVVEFQGMCKALPSSEFSKEITRKQAWETIAYFWLPEEWHCEAGIA